jgi:hypothetical protein
VGGVGSGRGQSEVNGISALIFAVRAKLIELHERWLIDWLRFQWRLCGDRIRVVRMAVFDGGDKRRNRGAIEAARAQQMREAVALTDQETCKVEAMRSEEGKL